MDDKQYVLQYNLYEKLICGIKNLKFLEEYNEKIKQNSVKLIDNLTKNKPIQEEDINTLNDIIDTYYNLYRMTLQKKENCDLQSLSLCREYVAELEKFKSNKEEEIIESKRIYSLPDNLQDRYKELIKAVNNNMPLSFFWLAGSIIEGVLCEYCKKNNIKSSNHNIEGYITAIEEDEKHKKIIAGITKKVIQIYKDYRNTIHSNNVNNNFIKNKNLQNRKEELDEVIKNFNEEEKEKAN